MSGGKSSSSQVRLVTQMRWVARLSVALSSAVRKEDVYSALLVSLVSPQGLGFAHAIVLELDEEADVMRGVLSMGLASPEEAEEIRRELEEESIFLEKRRRELRDRAEKDGQAAEELRMLEMGSQWVTVSQRLRPGKEEAEKVRNLTLEHPSAPSPEQALSICQALCRTPVPVAVEKRHWEGRIPAELDSLLPDVFALIPLRTSKGLQAVILADRRWADDPSISPEDLEDLDWFATQGALAIQNAALIGDLERAYGELKELDTLKSNFLSVLSHELRTPLTAIAGFTQLVLDGRIGPLRQKQRELLTRVSKNARHVISMVNDVIEIAELEAQGLDSLALESVDPLETLKHTLPKLEFRRYDNQVNVEVLYDDSVPCIQSEPRALEKMLFHLLDNAIKFSGAGQVVQVEFDARQEERLSIAVRDRGTGIPPDQLEKIFQQFYQVDSSMTRSYEGLGLGLAVTKLLAQVTKAELRVESEVGRGSTFSIVCPISTGRPAESSTSIPLPDILSPSQGPAS